MTIEHETGFFGALTSICCLLLMPACAAGVEGNEPFGEPADMAASDGDADEPNDDDTDEPVDDGVDEEPGDDGMDEPGDDGMDEPGDDGMDEPGDDGMDEPGDDGMDEPGDDGMDEPGDDGMDEPPMAEVDGDFQANPAVHAQFRYTSPGPISVDTPLFNEQAIDTKGLQYSGEVSNPGDQEDWVQFNIVPGQFDPTIGIFLDCGTPALAPQPLRAHLIDDTGDVLDIVACGDDETMVTLHGASSSKDYFVRVEVPDGSEHFDTFTLEIDAYCFQGCNYQAYQG